jgi:hypothetical protein
VRRRRLVGELAQRLDRHAGIADDPELGALEPAERLEQDVDPLVGAQQAEEEDHRALGPLQLRRQRPLLGQAGEVVEGAVRDDVDAAGVEADVVAEAAGAVLGVGDHRVHRAEHAPRRRHLAMARHRRQHVVSGHHSGTTAGQDARVELRHRQPLVMDDVGVERAAQAAHVGEVLRALDRAPAGGVEPTLCAAPVEALAHPVAVGVGDGAVEEPAGQQLDLGPPSRQGRGEGAVVGRRERRGVDELDLHDGRLWSPPWRPSFPTAW